MSNYVLDSLEFSIRSLEGYKTKKSIITKNIANLEKDIKRLEEEIKNNKDCKVYYSEAIELLYEESIGELKSTINTALKYIIFDKNYEVKLILEDKRGSKSLSVLLLDADTGLEVGTKDGCGQGIRTVISFILKMYYLLNKGKRILILDEKYSNLSQAYVDRFFQFLKKMCIEKNFCVIMITHDERFLDYADNVYLINDGNVKQKNIAILNTFKSSPQGG